MARYPDRLQRHLALPRLGSNQAVVSMAIEQMSLNW